MRVSWNWLKEYVALEMSQDELETRLAMSGLNHEGTDQIGDDLCIDLEVTSNRPDCLGHIGVAREISVLWDQPLCLPDPAPVSSGPSVEDLIKVRIDCPELCPRYTARVIRGVKIGPSPDWLVKRLETIFWRNNAPFQSVNNVVDITNYVMMENGQPLHAFDYAKIHGAEIIVRAAQQGEQFEAIDHKVYELNPSMCVIADAQRAVALGGVMGGADSEVADHTTDLLIESADFVQLPIRNTARKLKLHSDSSYRFERGVDPDGIDWASRRACELILENAGGELADGGGDVGAPIASREPIVLRLSQIERILGIAIDREEVRQILTALGNVEQAATETQVEVVPPTWRKDLTRECDLLEELARIHGYEEIPEDVAVPMTASHRLDPDRVLESARSVMTAAGFHEAMTATLVPEPWSQAIQPWSDAAPIHSPTGMRGVLAESVQKTCGGAEYLRQTLIPSLLEARRYNESLANPVIELFETARIYLPQADGLPAEQTVLSLVSGRGYRFVKGVLEAVVRRLRPDCEVQIADTKQTLFVADQCCELKIAGRRFGFLGDITAEAGKQFGLRHKATVAEVDMAVLNDLAILVPQHAEQSAYPAVARDLNLIVDESLRWSELADTVRQSAGELLESLQYQDTYRDPGKDGAGKKRLLFSILLRSHDRTLTGEEVDAIRDQTVQACRDQHAAELLA